ncbi:MAG: fused MFS/spermidine synthase [Proteobacteria bacterium]|nr:fused MFS/spermidine synthase [Pseudomonadota bacterium]
MVRLRLLAPLLTLTGAASLIYQVVWSRQLTLVLGSTSRAIALVLGTFMLGLALGAWLIGRIGDRVARPLRLFGWLELGAAATALGVTAAAPWLPRLHERLPYGAVATLALLLLLLPTALMGATLPTILAYVDRAQRDPERTRQAVSPLYAANTLGAVLGALAAGFLLIGALGFWASACVAAALELLVGLTAIALDRPVAALPREARAWPAAPAALALFVSGFATLSYEIVFTRLLLQGFLGTAFAFTIILAAFLAGLALGAALTPKTASATTTPLGVATALSALLAMVLVPLVVLTPELVELIRGRDVRFGMRLLTFSGLASALLGAPAVVWGMVFPLAARSLVCSGRAAATFGGAYWINTLGGLGGSLVTGFLLLPLVGARGALLAVAAVQGLVGAWLVARERRWPVAAVALGITLVGVVLAWPPRVGAQLGVGTPVPSHLVGREQQQRVLCYREGEAATTMVLQHVVTRQRALVLDGFGTAADGPGTGYMRMMGHLPLLLHPRPRRALVICLGTGATARAAASWRGVALDVAEINPDVLACSPHFTPANATLMPRVHLADGRTFLQRSRQRYDVITLEPMPPHFAGAVNLYSREYYELAARRLSAKGLIAQWVPLHLLAPQDGRQILATLQAVFPATYLFIMPGDWTGIALGARQPLELARLDARLPHAPQALLELGLSAERLRAAIVLDPEGVRRYARGAALITDDRPRLEYSGIDRVLGRFGSARGLLRFNLSEVFAAARPAARRP